MKEFKRENYKLKSYEGDWFKIDIEDDDNNLYTSQYNKDWEELYMLAKKLVQEGKRCTIWECRYVFE
jgi:hypothetical protein